jgi:hypothetical protein
MFFIFFPLHGQAHLFFSNAQANPSAKAKEPFFPNSWMKIPIFTNYI